MTVIGMGADGSVTLRDGKGAARSIDASRLEVAVLGRRGSTAWTPVLERAAEPEQRTFF